MFDVTVVDYPPPLVFECLVSNRHPFKSSWEIPLCQIAEEHLLTMEPEEMDLNWKLKDFFETIIVINLPRSTERWAGITAELKAIGTESFVRFDAIDGRKEIEPSIWQKFFSNREGYDSSTQEGSRALDDLHKGEAGCYMSHYAVLKNVAEAFEKAKALLKKARHNHDELAIQFAQASLRRYARVLILEDDSAFGFLEEGKIQRKGAGILLRQALQTLPESWDLLYFVAQATDPTKEIAPHLRKLKRSWSTCAYAVNHSMYTPLLNQLKKIEDRRVSYVHPLDHAISNIHHLHKAYAIYPSIVVHLNGISDISLNVSKELYQPQPLFKDVLEED